MVELARSLGMGRLGHVAMDSTRVAANASRDRVETVAKLRAERAKIRRQIRRWQKQCDAQSGDEAAGRQLSVVQMAVLEKRLGRNSAPSGAVAEERAAAAFGNRSRQPIPARPQGIHAELHGGRWQSAKII